MMKKAIHLFILIVVIYSSSAFASGGSLAGTGDPNDPYLIEDLADFDMFASDPNYWAAGVHTKLMCDPNLSGRTYTTAVIAPDMDNGTYGHQGTPFTGVFMGNNKTIQNFTVNHEGNSQIGIFGYIETGGEVRNLNITDFDIVGHDYVACLAGHVLNGTIENCKVTGKLECKGYTAGGLIARTTTSSITNCQSAVEIHSIGHSVGGLIGDNYDSSVTSCHSWATVSGDYDNIGGLIGHNDSGTIVNCSSTAIVFITGLYSDYVGGLIGYSGHGLVSSCWSNSQVTGRYYVGGLVGSSSFSNIIENSYSTGQVSGDTYVGGLVGKTAFDSSCVLTGCYAIGSVSGNSDVGGILGGKIDASLTTCFWDMETSGITDGVGNEDPDPAGVMGKTTVEMKQKSTFTNWDFTETWGIEDNQTYPFLRLSYRVGDLDLSQNVDLVDLSIFALHWLEGTE